MVNFIFNGGVELLLSHSVRNNDKEELHNWLVRISLLLLCPYPSRSHSLPLKFAFPVKYFDLRKFPSKLWEFDANGAHHNNIINNSKNNNKNTNMKNQIIFLTRAAMQ